jgi:hypothetical protein
LCIVVAKNSVLLLPKIGIRHILEKPEDLTTLRRNMINYLNIRSLGHLPCQSELARSGQGVRFFHHIKKVFDLTHWRIYGPKGAAQILDMNPETLRSRIKKLGIKRPELSE